MVTHQNYGGIFIEILLFYPIDKFTYLFIRTCVYIGISVFEFIAAQLAGIASRHMCIYGKQSEIKGFVSLSQLLKCLSGIGEKLLIFISPPDIVSRRKMTSPFCPVKIPEFKLSVIGKIELSSAEHGRRSYHEYLSVTCIMEYVSHGGDRRIERILRVHIVMIRKSAGLKRYSGCG